MKDITKRLRAAVEKSALTYAEIEEKLSLEEGTVERWVLGKEIPDTGSVKTLAEVLGVSADSILFGVEKIGEMKAMFPSDANPAPTPMADWRFLAGVIMIFVGVAGVLLMFMRYAGEGLEASLILDILGVPGAVLLAIALIGAALCIITCIMNLRVPKKKKGKDEKNEKR